MNLSPFIILGICSLCETTDATHGYWLDAEAERRKLKALHGGDSREAIEAGHVAQAAYERWAVRAVCSAKHEEQY